MSNGSTNQAPPDPNAPGGPAPPQTPPDPLTQAQDQTRGQVSPPNPMQGLMSLLGINRGMRDQAGGLNFNSDFDNTTGEYTGGYDPATQTLSPMNDQGPRPRQMYQPASANRPHGQWGGAWWPITAGQGYPGLAPGPYMPSPMESYGIIGGAGRQLQQWGSPFVGQPAGQASNLAMQFAPFLDMISKGAFSKNFNAARLQSLRIQQEQMLMNSEMAVERAKQELQQYGSVFKELELGGITPEVARERIRELAVGDPQLTEMLNSRDIYGVEKFLQWRDAKVLDLEGSNAQLRKSGGSDDRAQRAAWGESGTEGSGDIDESKLPGAPKTPDISQPAARGAAEGAPTPDRATVDQQIAQATHATPREMQAAHDLLNGRSPADYDALEKGGDIRSKIGQAQAALQQQVANAARSGRTIEEKLANVEKIDPDLALAAKDLVSYKADPQNFRQAGGNREKILQLARQIDPQYSEGKYKSAQLFWNVDRPENRVMTRSSSLYGAYQGVMVAAQRIPGGEDASKFAAKLRDFNANKLGREDPYYQLFAAERNFAQEASAVASGTGQVRVSIYNDMLSHLNSTDSLRQIRSVVQEDMFSSMRWLKEYQGQWERATGQKTLAPGLQADTWNDFQSAMRANPHTGEMPADADPRLRSLGVTAGHQTKELGELDRWTPLTQAQVNQYLKDPAMLQTLNDFVRDHEYDADAATRSRVIQAKKTLRALLYATRDDDMDLGASEAERTRNMPSAR